MLTIAPVPNCPTDARRRQLPLPRPVSVTEFPLGTIEARPLSQSSDQVTGVVVPATSATAVTLCPTPRT
jgi:hypothetical protein